MIALRFSTSPAASHDPGSVRVAVGRGVRVTVGRVVGGIGVTGHGAGVDVSVAGAGYGGPGGSVGGGASVAVGPAVTVGPGTTADTARHAFTRPGMPGPAASIVRASVPAGSRSPSATRSATVPAVTGDAIDVPESVAYPPPG